MSFIEETKEKEAAKERWKPWYSVPITIQEREESKFDYAERIQKQWEETHSEPFFRPFSEVLKPHHYADKEIETIDYIKDTLTAEEYVGYCIGNVMKYISRHRKKGGKQDLEKAKVYLAWAIESYEGSVADGKVDEAGTIHRYEP